MGGEHLGDVVAIETRVPHRHGGEAGLGSELRQPARLADGIGTIPFRLDVHGADDAMAAGVGAIVRRQVGAAERAVVAVAEHHRLILQPGIGVALEVPEMLVRVDNGEIVVVRHRGFS